MRGIRYGNLATLVAFTFLLVGPARAAFIYTLTAQTATGSGGQATTPLDMQLTLSDAAVESGNFAASRNCSAGSCISNSGNFDEISLVATNQSQARIKTLIQNSFDPIFDQTNISLTFGFGGSITSGSIFEGDSEWTLRNLNITANRFDVTFNSDAPPYFSDCANGNCSERGSVVESQVIPEPASLALLSVGLTAFCFTRRKRTKRLLRGGA